LAERAVKTVSAWQRAMGLMFRKSLPEGEALWIIPCNGVHTWFMRFPIDIVVLDKELRVLAMRRAVKPWRMVLPMKGAKSVLELEAGAAEGLAVGEKCRVSRDEGNGLESADFADERR
jgi:uncharacterized membrane protein (UPF0127 family)